MTITRRTGMSAGRQAEAINVYVGHRLRERRVLIGLSLRALQQPWR